jgi:preprotein translocase subunit Sec63
MYKFIWIILGFVIFGFIGAIIGYFIGNYFDIKVKKENPILGKVCINIIEPLRDIKEEYTNEELKKQYHLLCKKFHPDLNLNELERKKCEEKMKVINDVYSRIKVERGIK